ncbi:MAG: 50S ribosomal protein L13 [Actinobacteria bacterium]|nr:50S ribosomal protein L13 [Actinomycetota bacterium]
MGKLKLTKSTNSARPQDVERNWYLVDAEGLVLGRMATQISMMLRGKHKPVYTPNIDTGDHVVVINADKVVVTGGKELKKKYYHHSGYPGGLKEKTYEDLKQQQPERIIYNAVRGMMPKNRLGRAMLKKLHVYAGSQHPHQAQKPQSIEIKDR